MPNKLDERAIREVHVTWIDAVNAGDFHTHIGLIAEDALFLNPGRGPMGRNDFHAGFSAAHQASRIRFVSEQHEVTVVGEIAYTLSRGSLSVWPRSGGSSIDLTGRRIAVYRKQCDGRWLLARDAHTLVPGTM